MATVYAGHTADFTGKVEWAQRDDGQWFSRVQTQGPYGYRWSAWHKAGAPADGARAQERTVRLPVDGAAPRARPARWAVEVDGEVVRIVTGRARAESLAAQWVAGWAGHTARAVPA